jgi:hypothetical protein
MASRETKRDDRDLDREIERYREAAWDALIHKDLLDYALYENDRIIGVVATEKLRGLADEQSKKN